MFSMTRLSLKIFFTFWLITAVIIVGTNVVVHWFDMSPEGSTTHNADEEPGKRLLLQVVGNALDRSMQELAQDLRDMPPWSTRFIYVIDNNNQDLLQRTLPPGVMVLVPELTSKQPFGKIQDRNRKIFGRYITLNDGNAIRVITISSGKDDDPDRDIIWELFIDNIWPLLLVSILVSGSACFFLARHFTRSINTLQEATQKIAQGDLSVRISHLFKGRKDEIAALGRDFDNMTEHLEELMQEQKRLIKDVSHELRTPLARMQFAVSLAQKRSNGLVDNELARIKQNADYLNNIITDILSIPIEDKQHFQLDDVIDLVAMLRTVVDNYADEANEKNVDIQMQTNINEALVATHGNMLLGVFDNILRNALAYTAPHTEILVELKSLHHQFTISIHDQGSGVASQHLDNIFKPFFRTDEARARETGGYGLGLAIAQRSVLLHSGKISALNNPNGGLTVQVLLPVRE